MRLEDSLDGGFMGHNNFESSLVDKGKSKNILKQLMKLKESILGKLNESFSLGGGMVC